MTGRRSYNERVRSLIEQIEKATEKREESLALKYIQQEVAKQMKPFYDAFKEKDENEQDPESTD